VWGGWVGAPGAERGAVVGLSGGPTLALELSRRRPDIPTSLILAGAYAGWAGSLPPEIVEERLEQGLRDLSRPPADLAAGWLPSLLSNAAPAEVRAELFTIVSEARPDDAVPMLYSMAEADLRDGLPTIPVPTLLVHGER